MHRILREKFFNRSAVVVARELLGKFLVRRRGGRTTAAMITEVEAYEGPRDKASHASRGRTERNAPMFGPPGHWYVYFCYGMHWLANIVTGPREYPAAVLIRAVEDTAGPARVTKRFGVGRAQNGREATRSGGFWIEDRGYRVSARAVKRTPRIGVAYAGPVWGKKPFRFVVRDT